MNYINTFQNNEVLTGITILSVLKITNRLEITKCLLIEPLLSYKVLLRYLKNPRSKVRSIEELMIKQNLSFTNFNERFEEMLPISINAILLMNQMNVINIKGNELIYNGENFDFSEKSLGNIAEARIAASQNVAEILTKEDASSLYLSLRVEL